jgi:RNA polymerase sigma-70 factor, ECF subfamily
VRDAKGLVTNGARRFRPSVKLLRAPRCAACVADCQRRQASDVFLDVWKQAGRFEGRSQVSTWLLSIARHKALSLLRGPIHNQVDPEMLADIPDKADHAEAILEKQDTTNILRQCLMQLSPVHRETVDLVYYHGKSIADVAEITGTLPSTVKTRMFYARRRLAELLDARGLKTAA